MYTVNIYIEILTPTSGDKIYKWWRLLKYLLVSTGKKFINTLYC